MATSKEQFDSLLAQLGPAIASVKSDVETLLAKANAGEDFTQEATDLQTSIDALGAIHTEANPAPAPSGN